MLKLGYNRKENRETIGGKKVNITLLQIVCLKLEEGGDADSEDKKAQCRWGGEHPNEENTNMLI